MDKKIFNFITYITTNSHISGNSNFFFKKFRSFLLGVRYGKVISLIVKNFYMIKVFLNMNVYAIYKYGVFCFICVNTVLSQYTKILACKVNEHYLTAFWINGFLSNFKFVSSCKLLVSGKNLWGGRIPSVVYFDSLKFEKVNFVLDECNALRIPSLSILESDLIKFKSSYYTVGNSKSIATYIFYLYSICSNLIKIKNKRFLWLFKECLFVEFEFGYKKSLFRFHSLGFSYNFYTKRKNKKSFLPFWVGTINLPWWYKYKLMLRKKVVLTKKLHLKKKGLLKKDFRLCRQVYLKKKSVSFKYVKQKKRRNFFYSKKFKKRWRSWSEILKERQAKEKARFEWEKKIFTYLFGSQHRYVKNLGKN